LKDNKHDIDYFLKNPNFISWIKEPTPDSDIFWGRWLNNHPEDKAAFYRAKAILQRINFQQAKVSETKQEEVLDNILKNKWSNSFKPENQLKGKVFKLSPWVLKGAAAVLLLFIVFELGKSLNANPKPDTDLVYQSFIVKQNKKGERTSFYLPDSTKVFLNAGSSLRYPSQFSNDAREVTLVGEAYFDVAHDVHKKFSVKSGELVTVVHGTAFNVRAYHEEKRIAVSLNRGRVSVHSQEKTLQDISYEMFPGEKLEVTEDFMQAQKSTFDPALEFGWKDGLLVFNDANLNTFTTLIELWYGVSVKVVGETNKDDWKINGKFKKESLENVLKSLEFSRGISYKIINDSVTISINAKE
jgi:ferric-dicitrate binding protein FerR (iron transport regulator)